MELLIVVCLFTIISLLLCGKLISDWYFDVSYRTRLMKAQLKVLIEIAKVSNVDVTILEREIALSKRKRLHNTETDVQFGIKIADQFQDLQEPVADRLN